MIMRMTYIKISISEICVSFLAYSFSMASQYTILTSMPLASMKRPTQLSPHYIVVNSMPLTSQNVW